MINYGHIQFPDELYHKAMENTRKSPDGHWLWYGAKSGEKNHPQISSIGLDEITGERKVRVVSAAKLIWSIHNGGRFPYQLRRNKAICTNPLCVKPDCYYPIMKRLTSGSTT